MMRQVAGAFMECEKGRLVAKLRGARERKRIGSDYARKRKEIGKKVGGGNHTPSCGLRWSRKPVAFGGRKVKPAA